MAYERLPKGIGGVSRVTGRKLRKPWRARKQVGSFVGEDGKEHRLYRNVGYYATRKEAIDALMTDEAPSNSARQETFAQVYEAWSAKKFPEISDKLIDNYKRAFRRYEPIHARPFRELKVADYEAVITNDLSPSSQRLCKSVLSQMYEYALRHDICEKDYSKFVEFDTVQKHRQAKVPFSVEEVSALWNMVGQETVDIVLVGIYTGLRPTELLTLKCTDIEDGCFRCGIKTKNGRNRLVPIHPRISTIVEDYCRKCADFGVPWLFAKADGQPYDLYLWRRTRFDPLFPYHTPHEMRHSFATYARRSKMDRILVKRIMGHALNDLTEDVYTHIDADVLCEEMKKYEVK